MNSRKLHPETLAYLDKSDEERIRYIDEDKWINYPLSISILETLESKFNEPKTIRKEGMLIYGEPNNGKTALLQRFYRMHKPDGYLDEENDLVQMMPVVYTIAPTTPDESKLYSSILNSMEVPHRDRNTVIKKLEDVTYFMGKMHTKILIIDELHNILAGNYSRQRVFMNALKNLSNILSIPIIVAGTKQAYSAVNIDDQILSRFRPVELKRWSNDKSFRSFVATYEMTLPLKEESNLAKNAEIVHKLFVESEGLIGRAVTILKRASKDAIQSGREQIVLEDIYY